MALTGLELTSVAADPLNIAKTGSIESGVCFIECQTVDRGDPNYPPRVKEQT